MNRIDDTFYRLNNPRLVSFSRELASITEQAHQFHSPGEVSRFAEMAVWSGRTHGWRDGARRSIHTSTTAMSIAAADQFATDPDTAIRVGDEARLIWNTAGYPPPPSGTIEVSDPDIAHGPGVVAVLGMFAYHDAWHAAHQAASATVLHALEYLLSSPPHDRVRQEIRTAVADAVQTDRQAGPFAAPPTTMRGFVPFRRGGDRVAHLGVDGSATGPHLQEPGASQGRSR